MRTRQEQGSVWVILVVLVAVVVGSWQYSEYRAAQKRRVAAEALAQAEQRKRDEERVELEKRLAQEKQQQDALTEANKALDLVLARWSDASKIAGTTGRIALAAPVATLQEVRREAEALSVSPCMDAAKELLVSSMQHTIDGFITFMRNENRYGDTLAQPSFEEAAKQFAAFKIARAECSK
jgi:hypothetical protein